MNTADEIIKWFDSYDLHMGLEPVLKARRRLSVHCAGIAKEIQRLEGEHKSNYHNRKISEAKRFLEAEGTGAERSAKSIDPDLRAKEGKSEGELRGHKIMIETFFKIMDSMSSIINALNR